MERENVLDAFGGADAVLKRAAKLISKRLSDAARKGDVSRMEEQLGLKRGTISQLLTGRDRLTPSLCKQLLLPLRISIDQILGKFNPSDDLREQLSRDRADQPEVVLAFDGQGDPVKCKLELEAYARMRAIGEFFSSKVNACL